MKQTNLYGNYLLWQILKGIHIILICAVMIFVIPVAVLTITPTPNFKIIQKMYVLAMFKA